MGSPAAAIIQEILANSQNNWGQQSLVNVLNTANRVLGAGLGLGNSAFDPARDAAMGALGTGSNTLNDPSYGLFNANQMVGNAVSNLNPSQFQTGGVNTPGSINATLNGMTGQLYNANNTLGGVAANGGLLNGNQYNAENTANGFLNGTNAGQSNLLNAGASMLANNGQSAFTNNLQGLSQNVLGNLGQTGATNSGINSALSLLQNGGLNAQGQMGQNAALAGLLNGGQTSTLSNLENVGQNFAGQQAVLPTGMAASIAQDQAGIQAQNAAKAAQAAALARGGGPGATVSNGATNQALGDFFNQINQNSSTAYENALLNQQGLNLQQQGQGAQMALGASGVGAQQLGVYGNLLQQLTGEANQGIGTGLQGLSGLQNAQTGLANTYGNLGLGAGNLANQTAQTGGSLLNNYLNSSIAGGNLQNNMLGTQANTMIGASNGLNTAMGNFAGLNQQGQYQSGQLQQAGQNNFYNALNNLFTQMYNNNNLAANVQNSGMQTLGNLAGQGYNLAQAGLGAQSNLFQQYASTGLNNVANAANNLQESTKGLTFSTGSSAPKSPGATSAPNVGVGGGAEGGEG